MTTIVIVTVALADAILQPYSSLEVYFKETTVATGFAYTLIALVM